MFVGGLDLRAAWSKVARFGAAYVDAQRPAGVGYVPDEHPDLTALDQGVTSP